MKHLLLGALINMINRYSTIFVLLYHFNTTSSSVLTQYDGLEDDYWKWKESFGPKTTVFGRMLGYVSYFQTSPDPKPIQHDELQKKVLCHAFVESNNYVYAKGGKGSLDKKGKLRKAYLKHSTEFQPDDKIRDVIIGTQTDSLKMFGCATDEEDKHMFHLAFAEKKDYAFVVTTLKNEEENMKNVVFQALLQPDATIDKKSLHHVEELTEMFRKNVKEAIKNFYDSNLRNLCLMNDHQHFNICSVVADKLYKEPDFREFQSNTALNYIYKVQERCVLKEISDAAKNIIDEEEVMPCALNDETWSAPQFYLLRHITSTDLPASVYVLTNQGDGTLGLYTRVDNVMAMTMP